MRGEIVYMGFKSMKLKRGEEIEILEGLHFDNPPVKCTVLKEYKNYILITLEFKASGLKTETDSSSITMGIQKGQLLTGEVLLLRKKNGELLTGEKVARRALIKYATAEDC